MLDLTESIAPKSDQMNADDLFAGPRTFTITEARKGASPEQPFDFVLAEFPPDRPYKPGKSMRRIMVAAWGPDASTYVGKRMTLYRDATVRYGGQDVGGIRISALSDIEKPLTIPLTVTRGKRSPYRVAVLPVDVPSSVPVDDATVARLAALRAEWHDADPERRVAITAEVAELSAPSLEIPDA